LTSIVIIVAARVSCRPADAEHPFGHGRVEGIATITCAVLLGVAAFEFLKSSIERFFHPVSINASLWIIVVVIATIPVKEWLARFARVLGRASGNKALEAEFWHHRSDVLATVVVIVGMVAEHYGYVGVDAVMGVLVSLLLFKVAFDISREAVDTLLGKAPSGEEIQLMRKLALSVEGVHGVHDIVIHHYGDTRFVSLHVETTDKASAMDLHELAELVEHQVDSGRHGSVCVHIDPISRDHPEYEKISALVEAAVESDSAAISFHDLRIIGGESNYLVIFDVNLKTDSDKDVARKRLCAAIRDGCSARNVIIEVDPEYTYSG